MKFRKRIATILSMLVLGSGCVAAAEYEVGEQLQGFTLVEEREMKGPSATLRLWQHDKTGAQVYFIHNDDQDRTFSIAFRTEPSDDTGKLHILEHAVCAASENYPGQDVFFDAAAQAYITDINAATYKSATNYYVSSMSEDQLERMADFYLDCAFHSVLRSEPNYFYREGWRYTMEDMDSPLTIDGIVYNEMKGIFGDIYEMHYYLGLNRALFPDTYQKWESGGDPAVIPELTYEELIDFYDECYHPSNSVSMFYGDVETERYLRLMDEEYFSAFEMQESAGYSPGQEAFDQMVTYTQDFPVSADSEQTGGVISYAVALPEGMGFEEILALALGSRCLGDSSSPLMEALYDSGIGNSYYVENTTVGTQSVLIFTTDEADASRAEEFQEIVVEYLTAMVEEGFDQEMLDSIFAEMELSSALVSNQEGIGIEMASRIAMVIDSGYTEMLDDSACLDEVQRLCKDGGVEALFRQYVLPNTHTALVTTTPKAGLLEEQEAAETERLAKVKASMSQEELEKVIADTAAFEKWIEEGDSIPETLDKLRTDTPDTVSAMLPVYETEVLEAEGVTLYTADVEGEATYCQYDFDLSHLSKEEIRVLDVYVELLGSSTKQRSRREISIALQSLLSGMSAEVGVKVRTDGSVYPALSISFYALDENLREASELLMEMFGQMDLLDNAVYFDTAVVSKIQNFYDAEAFAKGMAFDAALAESSDSSRLQYILFGMDYYTWLSDLREMDETSLGELFAEVREKALVRQGANLIIVGDAEGSEVCFEVVGALLPEFSKEPTVGNWKEAMSEIPGEAVAFQSNGTSCYVTAGLDVTSAGLKNTAELQLLLAIMSDAYLLPEFRFQMGAYSSGASLSDLGIYKFRLYRAPSYVAAMSRLYELPGEMEGLLEQMTAEELAGYQLSVISSMTRPYGSWNEATDQIEFLRRGLEVSEQQAVLDKICSATPESLQKALPELQKIINQAGIAVVAPGTAVEEQQDLFDRVMVLP